jgi:hypothetical protein
MPRAALRSLNLSHSDVMVRRKVEEKSELVKFADVSPSGKNLKNNGALAWLRNWHFSLARLL